MRQGIFRCPSGAKVSSSRAPPPKVTITTFRLAGELAALAIPAPERIAAAAPLEARLMKSRRLSAICPEVEATSSWGERISMGKVYCGRCLMERKGRRESGSSKRFQPNLESGTIDCQVACLCRSRACIGGFLTLRRWYYLLIVFVGAKRIPLSSSTVKIRSTLATVSFSTVPLGQWISSRSTFVESPNPKCTRMSFEER